MKVSVSYLEIYNEKLKDLLAGNADKELKIYQTKGEGVFVKGLEKIACNDYSQIEKQF